MYEIRLYDGYPTREIFLVIFNEYGIQHFDSELKIKKIKDNLTNVMYKLLETGGKMQFIPHFYSLLMNKST